jgi:hypothetical protein
MLRIVADPCRDLGLQNPQRQRIAEHERSVEQLMNRSSRRHTFRRPASDTFTHLWWEILESCDA